MGNNNCFAISYNGDLLPCSKIPKYSLGNILKNDINTLINTEKLKKLSRIQAYEGCMKCNLVGLCRGCPAINNSLSKDVFLKDPQCWIGDI
ncbi:SPASM domain-containing protein [Clostridium butanoliproducens]|uniref:SPASM domain-containing protein n=1 Tax=Clostridium butanoliproducens TaxID=2991837 RepID=UPI0024B910F2|nr:SPASM domain-containing protein [Clostridium butanoliproducens]MDU1348662.1 SPASM domain-containing protein [Clostridium argentinense]